MEKESRVRDLIEIDPALFLLSLVHDGYHTGRALSTHRKILSKEKGHLFLFSYLYLGISEHPTRLV